MLHACRSQRSATPRQWGATRPGATTGVRIRSPGKESNGGMDKKYPMPRPAGSNGVSSGWPVCDSVVSQAGYWQSALSPGHRGDCPKGCNPWIRRCRDLRSITLDHEIGRISILVCSVSRDDEGADVGNQVSGEVIRR